MKRLLRHTRISDIIGDVIRVRSNQATLGDLAVIEGQRGTTLARSIALDGDMVTLQVYSGTRGLSTDASVRFLGHPMRVAYSQNILGRVFGGSGQAVDGGPGLTMDPKVDIAGPTVNPLMRTLPQRMIHTFVPMIDMFNSLVESQKIPIFSVPGEPYNELLARIGFQADADIVVFGGMGLIFDDFHYFRSQFEERGIVHRTVMFRNLASDPVVERVLIPDMALAVAEKFAVEEGKRVLVLLTDMTAYADALKEIGIALEYIPGGFRLGQGLGTYVSTPAFGEIAPTTG